MVEAADESRCTRAPGATACSAAVSFWPHPLASEKRCTSACGGASSDGDAGPGPAAADAGPVAPGGLAIQFSHEIQGEPLALNSAATLADGSPVTFSTFRYWFSNLILVGAAGVEDYVVPDAYYLIEQTNQSTRVRLDLNDVPSGSYQGLRFSVGVDEARNHSLDTLAGELDPGVGMSWNWNSGFIFLKAEGEVGLNSDGFEKNFVFHIGRDETYRTVELERSFEVTADQGAELRLRAELTQLFEGLTRENNLSILGGPTAQTIADNYGAMWTLEVGD